MSAADLEHWLTLVNYPLPVVPPITPAMMRVLLGMPPARKAPPPTLHRQLHSLQARALLSRWLRKHPGRHVYGMAVWEGWRM